MINWFEVNLFMRQLGYKVIIENDIHFIELMTSTAHNFDLLCVHTNSVKIILKLEMCFLSPLSLSLSLSFSISFLLVIIHSMFLKRLWNCCKSQLPLYVCRISSRIEFALFCFISIWNSHSFFFLNFIYRNFKFVGP